MLPIRPHPRPLSRKRARGVGIAALSESWRASAVRGAAEGGLDAGGRDAVFAPAALLVVEVQEPLEGRAVDHLAGAGPGDPQYRAFTFQT
jgi:hypothetical protein